MVIDTPTSSQDLIAISGKLMAASKKELANIAAGFGHRIVSPKNNGFSILVAGCQPDGAAIAKAKSTDTAVLTERQFLDRLPAPGLIERAKAEACDPTTSKKRLTELAAVVPEAVVRNPLWQMLHLENPSFLAKENGLLKLRLLQLASSDLLDAVVHSAGDAEISVDVHEVTRGYFEESDAHDLSREIKLSEFVVTIYCYDCDAEMEDLEQCDERLSIGDCIKAFLLTPFDDLRAIAERCGIEYEPGMSPRDGYPLRFAGINIESEEEFFEYESDSFPDDSSLIGKLNNTGEGIYDGFSLNEAGERRPLFSSSPVADEDYSYEGIVTLKWVCDCFVPIGELGCAETKWRRIEIDEEIEFKGSNVGEDYRVDYEINFPCELEADIVSDLKKNSTASNAVDTCLLDLLGLRSSDFSD
jgi:hypothetical protein